MTITKVVLKWKAGTMIVSVMVSYPMPHPGPPLSLVADGGGAVTVTVVLTSVRLVSAGAVMVRVLVAKSAVFVSVTVTVGGSGARLTRGAVVAARRRLAWEAGGRIVGLMVGAGSGADARGGMEQGIALVTRACCGIENSECRMVCVVSAVVRVVVVGPASRLTSRPGGVTVTVMVSVVVLVTMGVVVEVRVTVGVKVTVDWGPAEMENERCAARGAQPLLLLLRMRRLHSPLVREDLASSQVDCWLVKSGVKEVLLHGNWAPVGETRMFWAVSFVQPGFVSWRLRRAGGLWRGVGYR